MKAKALKKMQKLERSEGTPRKKKKPRSDSKGHDHVRKKTIQYKDSGKLIETVKRK